MATLAQIKTAYTNVINKIGNSLSFLAENKADVSLSDINATAINKIRTATQSVEADSIYQKDVHVNPGEIILQDGVTSYDLNVTANTTISFNASQLSEPVSMKTFELLISMETLYSITFAGVAWLDNNAPDLSTTGLYLFAFRTYAGWDHWEGNLQGKVY